MHCIYAHVLPGYKSRDSLEAWECFPIRLIALERTLLVPDSETLLYLFQYTFLA